MTTTLLTSKLITPNSINISLNYKPYSITRDHPNYAKVVEALYNNDYDVLEGLMRPIIQVERVIQGQNGLQLDGDLVTYKGQALHNHAVEAMLKMRSEGFDISPMINFLEKVMMSQSYQVVDRLYKFLESHGLTLTPDGDFLAYKAVRKDNYNDWYTNSVRHQVGDKPRMERHLVDDNANSGCSKGFHFGNLDYVKNFHRDQSIIVVVKVNPADVVCVPHEDFRKVRGCGYEVVNHFTEELTKSLYNSDATAYTPPSSSNDDRWNENDDEDSSYFGDRCADPLCDLCN